MQLSSRQPTENLTGDDGAFSRQAAPPQNGQGLSLGVFRVGVFIGNAFSARAWRGL
jgi:hypothetical protein